MATPSEKHEIHCAKRYLEYTETPFYRAFRDKENPESEASNYAVLKRMEDAEESLREVEKYYKDMDITPVFHSKPDSVTLEESREFFENHGYTITTFATQRMMHLTRTSPGIRIHACPVKLKAEPPLTGAEAQLVAEYCGERDYGIKRINKQLAAGGRISFAYNHAEIPVSFCVGEEYGSAFCVCDLFTSQKFRRKGYGAAAMLMMLSYAKQPERGYTDIYLQASSDDAVRLCERLGFRGTQVEEYRACKGTAVQQTGNPTE